MKTPIEFQKNLKNHIITEEMLETCLFSLNKRAKNCRDKKRDWRHSRARHALNNYETYEAKMIEYYRYKENLLSILKPICIHKEFLGYETERIYDYQKKKYKAVKEDDIVWCNCYFDRDRFCEVYFVDVELKDKPKYHYYLFYETSNYSFHSPINEEDVSKYGLPVIDIDRLNTHGKDIDGLISVQFVKKVVQLIKKNNYTYQTAAA